MFHSDEYLEFGTNLELYVYVTPIQDARLGDSLDSFTRACLNERVDLARLAHRVCRDREAARDLVQDTLLRAFRARSSYDGVRSIKAWLRRILVNCYVEQYRHRRRYLRLLDRGMPDLARAMGGGDPDEIETIAVLVSRDQLIREASKNDRPRHGSLSRRSDADGLGDEAAAALARLRGDHRAVVERCMIGSERCVAVARDLGVPLGTLLSRLSRARRILERDLRAYAEAEYGIGHRPVDGRRRPQHDREPACTVQEST